MIWSALRLFQPVFQFVLSIEMEDFVHFSLIFGFGGFSWRELRRYCQRDANGFWATEKAAPVSQSGLVIFRHILRFAIRPLNLWLPSTVIASRKIGGIRIKEINRVRADGVGEERRPIHQIG